jgi:hypothetical protein
VAVTTEEGDVEGFLVIPVVPLEPATSPAPGTASRAIDQAKLLGQRGGVTSRTRPDSPGPKHIGGDFQVALKTGELGVLTVPSNLFHDTYPKL